LSDLGIITRVRQEKDFEDFLKCLNKHKVRYCIVGAFAVIFHSRPRFTEDMDILIFPDLENSKRTKKAMAEFGVDVSNLEDEYFARSGNFYQIGVAPVMIHIINSLEGVSLSEVFKNKVKSRYGRTNTYYIGLDELIKNKKVAGRPQDKLDLEVLKKAKVKNRFMKIKTEIIKL